MRHLFKFILSVMLYLLASIPVAANTVVPVSVDANYEAIGNHASYLRESTQALTIEQANAAYSSGEFINWNKPVLSFGIGSSPIWVRFTVDNSYPYKILRRLIIENSWLDLAEIFIVRDGQVIAERIRKTVSNTQVMYGISRIKTTISCGVAQIDAKTRSIDELFTVADAGLYQAKQTGRNKVCAAWSDPG